MEIQNPLNITVLFGSQFILWQKKTEISPVKTRVDEVKFCWNLGWCFQLMFLNLFSLDVEKQLSVEKESLDNLRLKIEEAQKQSG